ncbi:hypothetical protein OQA88_10594 [Cercophora sp. LCS_1]
MDNGWSASVTENGWKNIVSEDWSLDNVEELGNPKIPAPRFVGVGREPVSKQPEAADESIPPGEAFEKLESATSSNFNKTVSGAIGGSHPGHSHISGVCFCLPDPPEVGPAHPDYTHGTRGDTTVDYSKVGVAPYEPTPTPNWVTAKSKWMRGHVNEACCESAEVRLIVCNRVDGEKAMEIWLCHFEVLWDASYKFKTMIRQAQGRYRNTDNYKYRIGRLDPDRIKHLDLDLVNKHHPTINHIVLMLHNNLKHEDRSYAGFDALMKSKLESTENVETTNEFTKDAILLAKYAADLEILHAIRDVLSGWLITHVEPCGSTIVRPGIPMLYAGRMLVASVISRDDRATRMWSWSLLTRYSGSYMDLLDPKKLGHSDLTKFLAKGNDKGIFKDILTPKFVLALEQRRSTIRADILTAMHEAARLSCSCSWAVRQSRLYTELCAVVGGPFEFRKIPIDHIFEQIRNIRQRIFVPALSKTPCKTCTGYGIDFVRRAYAICRKRLSFVFHEFRSSGECLRENVYTGDTNDKGKQVVWEKFPRVVLAESSNEKLAAFSGKSIQDEYRAREYDDELYEYNEAAAQWEEDLDVEINKLPETEDMKAQIAREDEKRRIRWLEREAEQKRLTDMARQQEYLHLQRQHAAARARAAAVTDNQFGGDFVSHFPTTTEHQNQYGDGVFMASVGTAVEDEVVAGPSGTAHDVDDGASMVANVSTVGDDERPAASLWSPADWAWANAGQSSSSNQDQV